MFKSCKIYKKSVPLHYINECGSSSVGRAWASQAQGRGFEPRLPLTFMKGMHEKKGKTSRRSFLFSYNEQFTLLLN